MAENVYTAPVNKYLDGTGLVELWKRIVLADKANATAIEGLKTNISGLTYDSDSVVKENSYISKITQTNGLIAVEKTALPVTDIKVAFQPGAASEATSVVSGGVATITYDSAISDTSRNAIQNKVVKKYVDDTAQDKVNAAKTIIDAYTVNGTTISTEGGVKLGADNIHMASVDGSSNTIALEIEDIKTAQGKVTIIKKTDNLPTNVKEQYFLTADNINAIGDPINIYKDSSLEAVDLTDKDANGKVGQFLHFTYITINGEQQEVYMDVSALLSEAEMKDGLEKDPSGEIRVKIDNTSEKDSNASSYLSVSAEGVKVAGINAEIDKKINALKGNTESLKLGELPTPENNDLSAEDTVTIAISKLQGQIDDDSAVTADLINDLKSKIGETPVADQISTAVTTAINNLDSTTKGKGTPDAADKQNNALSSVTITDGKITEATYTKIEYYEPLTIEDIKNAIAAGEKAANI